MINIMYNYKSKGLKNALDLRSNHSVYGKLQLGVMWGSWLLLNPGLKAVLLHIFEGSGWAGLL